ncbi:MAG: PqiC family protein [Steroidobacteraceae bacterium]
MTCKASALARTRAWMLLPALLAAGPAALIAGCGRSPNTQFFTLAPTRPDSTRRTFAGAPVQVRAVHIPAYLDRPQRVIGRSPQRLDILETQQWGGPLDDMIRRVLTEDLATRLGPDSVVPANVPAPPGSRGLVVDIEEFQPDASGAVLLDASWVVRGNARQGVQGQQRLQVASGTGADAQVQAMSTLLGRLADAIGAALGPSP